MGDDIFFHAEPSGEMDERLLDEPASRSIVRGVEWIMEGFFLFREYPLSWMRIAFILLACEWALTSLAQHLFIAGLVLLAIYMLFKAGGLLMAASIQEHEERPPGIGQMFLILEGKVFEFILLLILLFFAAAAWGYLLYGIAGALGLWNPLSGMADIFMFLLWFLTVQQLLGFAPVLVFIQDETPMAAIIQSVKASFKNILPLTLSAITQGLLMAAAFWLLGRLLGNIPSKAVTYIFVAVWLFFSMVSYLTTYAAYRDIWFEPIESDGIQTGYR